MVEGCRKRNAAFWDEAVVPEPQAERPLLSYGEVQLLSEGARNDSPCQTSKVPRTEAEI